MTRVAAVLLVLLPFATTTACSRGDADGESNLPPAADSGITTLQTQDVTEGSGAEARKGTTVRVHYTGWLYDPAAADRRGAKFDSSRDRNEPYEVVLGNREVIDGWDEGIVGMKVGGTRVLTIPPSMAYQSTGVQGVIPPNATLLFEIELLEVR